MDDEFKFFKKPLSRRQYMSMMASTVCTIALPSCQAIQIKTIFDIASLLSINLGIGYFVNITTPDLVKFMATIGLPINNNNGMSSTDKQRIMNVAVDKSYNISTAVKIADILGVDNTITWMNLRKSIWIQENNAKLDINKFSIEIKNESENELKGTLFFIIKDIDTGNIEDKFRSDGFLIQPNTIGYFERKYPLPLKPGRKLIVTYEHPPWLIRPEPIDIFVAPIEIRNA